MSCTYIQYIQYIYNIHATVDDVDVIPYLYKYVIHTDVKLGEEAQITEVGVHIADVTHFLRPGTVGRPERILFLESTAGGSTDGGFRSHAGIPTWLVYN